MSLAGPGSTIILRGGTYSYNTTVNLAQSGTAAQRISVVNMGGEHPVLDFSTQPLNPANRAFLLTGNYWLIKGIEIENAGDNGIKVEGSHNRIEACVLHDNDDTGIQIGFAHTTVNDGSMGAFNEIINCDSYRNFDIAAKGGNADGFACKLHAGKGNIFIGCRAWENSDDGWDLFESDWPVTILNCWVWHSGDRALFDPVYLAKTGTKMSSFSGNGNGFKLGGNGTGGSSKGTHVLKNSVVFGCNFGSKKGVDQNSHKGGVIVYNCLSFANGYNFMFKDSSDSGVKSEFKNNVSFGHLAALDHEFASDILEVNNSWDLPVTADANDFQSLAESLAKAPRQIDGSLPNNAFAKLVSGSDLIDKGINVGLPFNGAAPDLGAFELP